MRTDASDSNIKLYQEISSTDVLIFCKGAFM